MGAGYGVLRLLAPQREEVIVELKVGIETRNLGRLLCILGIAAFPGPYGFRPQDVAETLQRLVPGEKH
jgi:hypothetical protein